MINNVIINIKYIFKDESTSYNIFDLIKINIVYKIKESLLKSELKINNILKISKDKLNDFLMFLDKIISITTDYRDSVSYIESSF